MATSSSSPPPSEPQQLLHVQVIQKRDRPHLSITGLLKAFLLLPQQHNQLLHTLSLPNVSIGAQEAKLLASLLKHKSPSPLRNLQVGQLEVTPGATLLLAAVASSPSLHELHLRLRVGMPTTSSNTQLVNLAHAVCRALQQNGSLRRVSLWSFALLGDCRMQLLMAQTVRANPQWTELRLHACNFDPLVVPPPGDVDVWNNHFHHHASTVVITDLQALANAVATHPNLRRVDLSHNDLCDHGQALLKLLQSNSIVHLGLSQNLLGYSCNKNVSRHLQQQLHDALRHNMVLQELWLDGNPVSEAFAQNVLLKALQYANTTLRACVVRPNLPHGNNDTVSAADTMEQIRYLATLNAAGRGAWRRALESNNHHRSNNNDSMGALLAEQPSLDTTYGLMREDPGRWVRLLEQAPTDRS